MGMSVTRQRYTFAGSGEDFGPRADGLVTAHTTQSSYNRLTVADAIVLARWQDRSDILGSYGDLICIDGILECVPPSHASGGINPASADFSPEPWLYDLMSREMVRNPNYFTRNVSFMGDMFWFDANGWPPQMIDNFVTVMLEEEARIKSRTILTDHEDFQTNRSDAGPIANALIRKRYLERTQEDIMLNFITEDWNTLASSDGFAGFFYIDGPSVGDKKWFTAPERVTSFAETTDFRWRLIAYGTEVLYVPRLQLVPVAGSRRVGVDLSVKTVTVEKIVIEQVIDQAAVDQAVRELADDVRAVLPGG